MPASMLPKNVVSDAYFHIYNKGNNNRIIFENEADYQTFTSFIKEYLDSPVDPESRKTSFTVNGRVFRGTPHQPKNYYNEIVLVSYVLSANHFHLLLHQTKEGAIARFMKSLCTRYSMYFNKKYHKSGSLFDRSYKSVEVTEEALVLPLASYLYKNHKKEREHSLYLKSAENYSIKPEMEEKLEGISFEKLNKPMLEGITKEKNLTSIIEPKNIIPAQSPHVSRWTEYLITVLVFVVLLSVSLIKVTLLKEPELVSRVLSASIIANPEPTPKSTNK